jgi:hypothetical protein
VLKDPTSEFAFSLEPIVQLRVLVEYRARDRLRMRDL